MKKLIALAFVAALLAATPAVFAGDFSGTGEIVEMNCYNRNGAKGEGHVDCAKRCFGNGSAIGLLMSDDSVKTLVPANDDVKAALIELAGQQASVSGTADGDNVNVTAASPAG